MGTTQSRQRYLEVAYDAFENARDLQRDLGGPPICGAILAYIDDRINAECLTRLCTQIEANEFARLAGPVYQEWINRHEQQFRCDPGQHGVCRYPRENLHFQDCGYYQPLPPDIQVDLESAAQNHGHVFRGQDAGAYYYGNNFSDGYGDEDLGVQHSRGHLFHSSHQDQGDHPRHIFHSRSVDEYEEGHLNAHHAAAEFYDGEGLTGHNGTRSLSHRLPQSSSLPDDLTDEYDSASEGFVASTGSYVHIDNDDFSGGDGSRPSASSRPRDPIRMNRGFSGTAHTPGSQSNVEHRHDHRRRVFASSAIDPEHDRPRTRERADDDRGGRVRVPASQGREARRGLATRLASNRAGSGRTAFAPSADRGTGQGGVQTRGSHRSDRGNRGSRAPFDNSRASYKPIVTPDAVRASGHVNLAPEEGHGGQRNAAPIGCPATARHRVNNNVNGATGRSEDTAEDEATAELIRRFNSLRSDGSSG